MKDILNSLLGQDMNRAASEAQTDHLPWINAVGGFGDMLMVSGVLKLVFDQDPANRFNLVRRGEYLHIFQGHPAISKVGFAPKEAMILGTNYWDMETTGPGEQRPFQILARAFGLSTPVEERLYLPDEPKGDQILHNFLPWKKRNILIAPASDSPRKVIDASIWRRLIKSMVADGALVIQAGRLRDQHIRNAYSVLGLTTPKRLIALVKKCDLVITSDNFIMHAAHLAGTKAVVIWGPTHHKVYGYPGQVHLQMPKMCGPEEGEDCLGASYGNLYCTACPLGEGHCLNQVNPEMVYEVVREILG